MPHADNLPNTTSPAVSAPQTGEPDPAPGEFAERRCWRCLKMFPGDSPAGPSPSADFWLCDPCDATLIPQRSARR